MRIAVRQTSRLHCNIMEHLYVSFSNTVSFFNIGSNMSLNVLALNKYNLCNQYFY